jgi:hypothetical protein
MNSDKKGEKLSLLTMNRINSNVSIVTANRFVYRLTQYKLWTELELDTCKTLTHINPTSCRYVLDLHHVNLTDFPTYQALFCYPKTYKCSLIYKANASVIVT